MTGHLSGRVKTTGNGHVHGYKNVIYAAEARAEDRCPTPEIGMTGARALLREVVDDWWFWPREQIPVVTLTFYRGARGTGWAYRRSPVPEIRLSKQGIDRHTVLHELAHIVTPDDPGHGAAFLYWYRVMLSDFDKRFHRSLNAALRHYGVR